MSRRLTRLQASMLIARPGVRRAPLLTGASLCIAASTLCAQAVHPPSGHLRSMAARNVSEAPCVDGRLDAAAWKDGAFATGFWISADDRAPREATEVRVLADDQAVYFAFKCHDAQPEKVHAEQLKRDADLSLDDHV